MTNKNILFFLAAFSSGTALATPECICNCNCREEVGRCPDKDCAAKPSQPIASEITEYDFRHPKLSVTFGLGVLEGKDPDMLVIRRTEPFFLRYEHRFAEWLYFYVTFKTELTDLTYYHRFVDRSVDGMDEPPTLNLQVGLKSRWNRVGGAGMRFVPYHGDKLTLGFSIGFEEMALADVEIENVYFINPVLSFELGDMVRDHARIRYNWRKLDFETRLDWTLPWLNRRFTPHFNLGAMLAKSDIEIWYDEKIAQRITDAGAAGGVIPIIPNHETFYVFAPSVGGGLEFRLTDHVGFDISGSALPFGRRRVYIGTLGFILKQ